MLRLRFRKSYPNNFWQPCKQTLKMQPKTKDLIHCFNQFWIDFNFLRLNKVAIWFDLNVYTSFHKSAYKVWNLHGTITQNDLNIITMTTVEAFIWRSDFKCFDLKYYDRISTISWEFKNFFKNFNLEQKCQQRCQLRSSQYEV